MMCDKIYLWGRKGVNIDLDLKQKEVMENKVKHGWNTEKIPEEFCYLYGEVGEAYDAWLKGKVIWVLNLLMLHCICLVFLKC